MGLDVIVRWLPSRLYCASLELSLQHCTALEKVEVVLRMHKSGVDRAEWEGRGTALVMQDAILTRFSERFRKLVCVDFQWKTEILY